MTRSAADLLVRGGIFAVLWAGPARAQGTECRQIAVEAEATVSAQWPGLLGTVQQVFSGREDIDRCARITLRSRDKSIGVEVVLPSGRFASRSVSLSEDVVPTLEALLLLPRGDAPPLPLPVDSGSGPASSPASPSASPRAPSATTEDVPIDPAPPPSDKDAAPVHPPYRHLGIELSVATGARIGDGQTSLGLGALSFLDLSGWLVGFEGRLDRYQRLGASSDWQGPPDGASMALELSVLGGRRVRVSHLAFDFLLGPVAAIQGTFTSQTQTEAGTVTRSSQSTVPRLLVVSRLNFAAPSTLHAFVSLDGEFGPSRGGGIDLQGAPLLPIWTFGLALGATVGTR
jgi:hypothetical protein